MKSGTDQLEDSIYLVRGQRVMLDRDLARLYGVSTSRLNQQVKRNLSRFPEDFMFQLTRQELTVLMSQFVTSKSRGGIRKLPRVFTEHGAIMLASVLNSERAIEASVFVVRAFVRLRGILANHRDLASKLAELERKVAGHDEDIRSIVSAIRQLMSAPVTATKRIGFKRE